MIRDYVVMQASKFSVVTNFKNKQYRNSLISFNEATQEIKSLSCEVKPEDFLLGRKLGEGSMGEVFECTYRGTECAAKRLKKGTTEDSVQYNDLLVEAHSLANVGRHPNIVTFYGACIQDQSSPGESRIHQSLARLSMINNASEHCLEMIPVAKGAPAYC